jgi:transposase
MHVLVHALSPQSVLLLDNAHIHHSKEIWELVESFGKHPPLLTCLYRHLTLWVGCKIEYLLPYSPNFQPIKQDFSTIKLYLRRIGIGAYPTSATYYKLYRTF